MELLCQGAESKVLKGQFLGRAAIIKERFPKRYRHPQLDETLSKERLRSESRVLMKCRAAGLRVPTVYFVDLINRSLILEYFEDSITARLHIGNLQGIGDDQSLIKLVRDIGAKVATMHQNNVIHGDLTTSNILVLKDGQLVIIDFGLSYIESNAEDKGVDLYVLERAFLSTHPNTQVLFDHLIDEYCKSSAKVCGAVMKKLDDIRLRGRKRTMVG